MKRPKFNRLDNKGDTIIEVLVCIAIFGAVLGAAYVTSNRNALINQASQERLAGTRLAESQLEMLKAKSGTTVGTEQLIAASSFCMSGSIIHASTHPNCSVDSSGAATTSEPIYRLKINKVGGDANGAVFKVSVTWANVKGTGNDSITYQYGVYK